MIRKYIERKFNEKGFVKKEFVNPNDPNDKTFTYPYMVERNIDWIVGKTRAFIALCFLFPLCFDALALDLLRKEFSMLSIVAFVITNIMIIWMLWYLVKRQLEKAFEYSKEQLRLNPNNMPPVKEAWVKKTPKKKLCVIIDGFPYYDTYKEYTFV